MSVLRLARNCGILSNTFNLLRQTNINKSLELASVVYINRGFSLSSIKFCEEEKSKPRKYDKPNRDRSKKTPVETSVKYLKSDAYHTTYGENPVWFGYRRVHKGGIPPKLTRESCIRFNVVTVASPCPICRDEYLVLDHRNLDLLKQFISPHTGEV